MTDIMMKFKTEAMNQTKVGSHTYINVPLPEGAESPYLGYSPFNCYVNFIIKGRTRFIPSPLPDGKWELVGICHVIAESEELAKGVVEGKPYPDNKVLWTFIFEQLMTANNWKPNDLLIRKIE